MAESPVENATEVEQSLDIPMEDDDITVETATTAPKPDFIAAEMTESVIRFEIPYRNRHPKDDDIKIYVELMRLLSSSFDDMELRLYDNKNQKIKDLANIKWHDKKYHASHFTTHKDTGQRKTVIAHRIRSIKPLSTLKGKPVVIEFLKKTNLFLRAHF